MSFFGEEEKKTEFKPIQLPTFDDNQIKNFYKPQKPKGPEFLSINTKGRDIYGRLSFNTGIFWLGGFAAGGVYGFVEGFRNAPGHQLRIRMNSVMNGMSKYGSHWGSAIGIIAFMHTLSTYAAEQLELEHHTGLALVNPAFAGITTGVVYKSTRGARAAVLAGCIGGAASVAYFVGSNFLFDQVFGSKGRF